VLARGEGMAGGAQQDDHPLRAIGLRRQAKQCLCLSGRHQPGPRESIGLQHVRGHQIVAGEHAAGRCRGRQRRQPGIAGNPASCVGIGLAAAEAVCADHPRAAGADAAQQGGLGPGCAGQRGKQPGAVATTWFGSPHQVGKLGVHHDGCLRSSPPCTGRITGMHAMNGSWRHDIE
jgi:hypothetical protein